MPDGNQDISSLFSRVSALEQDDANSDLTVTRIVKVYGTLGLRVTMKVKRKQYRICGDQNPVPAMAAVCAADAYI